MYHQEKGIMRYGFVIFEILVVKVEFIATLVQDCLVPFKRLVVVMDITLRVGVFEFLTFFEILEVAVEFKTMLVANFVVFFKGLIVVMIRLFWVVVFKDFFAVALEVKQITRLVWVLNSNILLYLCNKNCKKLPQYILILTNNQATINDNS